MLRINVINTPEAIRFVLSGKLYGPWASELAAVWQENLKTVGNRKIVVDLKETTAIDQMGVRLLADMCDAGAKLVTSGVLTPYLVESFRKSNNHKHSMKRRNNHEKLRRRHS